MGVTLCDNCMDRDARPVEVGPERGTQREPYRNTVTLCSICSAALQRGEFVTLHRRYADETLVRQFERGAD